MKRKVRKLDKKSKEAQKALEDCYRQHRSIVETEFERNPIQDPNKLTFTPAGSSRPSEFFRLKTWLNHMAESDPPEPVAYSALLQVWLAASGIEWPADVFNKDYARAGSGRPAGETHSIGRTICEQLDGRKPHWGELGQEYFKGTKNRKKAADKARLAVRTFIESTRFAQIDDREIAEAAYAMLAWEWYEDVLDREIGPEREE